MLKQIENTQQQQNLPGYENEMEPPPIYEDGNYKGSEKLLGKVAIVTGGDSGIGRAIAILFAKEGADVVIPYLCEDEDANKTKDIINQIGKRCIIIKGDLSEFNHSKLVVNHAMESFGKIDILVNHAGEQYQTNSLDDITPESLERLFKVNVFSVIFLTQATLPYLKKGAAIINTTSIVAYKGNPSLLDYTATRGAVLTFTRSLASLLAKDGIRVNGVAPGPIWTPLIPASFSPDKLKKFGQDTLLERPGQPYELAPAYVYLASNIDSSYVTGQVIHVNGGGYISS